MLVPGVNGLHAVDLRQRGRPMHVAVAHQVEESVDTFIGKGLGQHLVNRQVARFLFHRLVSVGVGAFSGKVKSGFPSENATRQEG
jgi:hypothetical protein